MLGLNDLGINAQWRTRYVGYGKRMEPLSGSVALDVGGQTVPGVIDHHYAETPYLSATSALVDKPYLLLEHLLGPLNATYYSGNDIDRKEMIFEFVTHEAPDWDAASSFFLADYLLHHGHLPSDLVAKALRDASDLVDQGKARIGDNVVRPFLIYLMMMNNGSRWDDCLLRGKILIETIIKTAGNGISRDSFLDPLDPPPEFADEAKQLHSDFALFWEDMRDVEQFDLFVPTRNAPGRYVKALAFLDQTRSKLQKYWAREKSETEVLFVPYRNKQGHIVRVVISVDPHSDLTLPFLGFRLEKAETEKRSRLGRKRGGSPRFEPEYCDNGDPWFDGRSHGFTIVDSPREGTVLEYREIIDIAKDLFRELPAKEIPEEEFDAFISYRRQGGSDIAWAIKMYMEASGKRVFLDVASLRSGRFDMQLLKNIAHSKNVILILSHGALDRCREDGDWVRKEITEALRLDKRVIPVFSEEVRLPPPDDLPEGFREALRYNGVTINHEHFYASMNKLAEFMR